MGAPTLPLPPFEGAVGSRGAALSGRELVVIHRQAHRTARLAPFKTCGDKDFIKPFLFGL